MQNSIFDEMYDDYKQTKPLRVIEFFAGYGSQLQSLRYLSDFFGKDKINYQHYKICEWALPSIIAYADMHKDELLEYGNDFCGDLTKEQIAKELCSMGVSLDYNEPATYEKLCRVSEDRLRLCFNSIMWTDNLVDISRVKGSELNINDTDMFTYLLTYSFPCQDLSLAGKRELMKKGSSTRSGLLWQVERILTELNEIGKNHLPQLLLMENVPQVHGAGAKNDFDDWIRFLEKLGYKCYYDDLVATDYGIPQTRNRTFMISILGDYNYRFPKSVKLKLRLKDLLENNVDEKYYLSDKIIEQITHWKSFQNPLDSVMGRESVCGTITTRIAESQDGGINASMKVYSEDLKETTNLRNYKDSKCIIENKAIRLCGLYDKEGETHQAGSIYDKNGCSPTLDCSSGGGNRQPFIIEKGLHNKNVIDTLNNNKNNIDNIDDVGYIDAYNRNIITDGTAKTILTGVDFRNQDFLIIKNATKQGYLKTYEGDGIDISSRMESHRGTVQNGKAQTLNTMGGENVGVVVKSKDIPNDKVIDLVGLRIRKLTPKECFRLQGVKDREIDFIMKNQTNSSGYHLAGDSICIVTLLAVFGEIFRVDWRKCLPSENIKDWWELNE